MISQLLPPSIRVFLYYWCNGTLSRIHRKKRLFSAETDFSCKVDQFIVHGLHVDVSFVISLDVSSRRKAWCNTLSVLFHWLKYLDTHTHISTAISTLFPLSWSTSTTAALTMSKTGANFGGTVGWDEHTVIGKFPSHAVRATRNIVLPVIRR